jgi:hypothetical protein
MAAEMTPELWYELERIENAWYEIGTQQLSFNTHERIQRLKDLVRIGYARWWEHTDGRHGFFGITEEGCAALKAYRRQQAEDPRIKWPRSRQ